MAVPENVTSTLEGVANLSLGKLGQAKRITDLTADTHPYAKEIRLFIYQVIREVQTEFRWGELTRSVTLEDPAEEIDGIYRYVLPEDYLRPASNREQSYRLEDGFLWTPVESNFQLKYIRYSVNPEEWSPLLLKCIYFRLAMEICMPITEDDKRYDKLNSEYETTVFPRAQRIASFDNENPRSRRARGTYSRTRGGSIRSAYPYFYRDI